jgi:serine/threonine-protein kinase RsbW
LAPVPDDVALAPEQSYEIRRMLPEEAVQVSQLMYRTYGGTYFNEDVYYPERIAAQNANGSLVSVVAVAEDGSVVAHEAVERDEAGPVAELGQAATDPAHRGRGLMSRIKQLLAKETQHMDLAGWFADAVAVHTFTQQSNAHHGGHVCGVDLGISPKSEAFRSIADQQSQRVSCLIYFHWLVTPQVRTVHVPARHQAIINKVYANLECPVVVGEETSNVPGHGSLKIKRVSGAATAFISVEEMGLDSAAAIRRAVRELIEVSRAEAVFVDLPLADPLTAVVWDSLAADGLGFVGIGPHFSTRGDIARLAYLVEPMVREPIKTFEPFAGDLVDYVLAEQDRVRANL